MKKRALRRSRPNEKRPHKLFCVNCRKWLPRSLFYRNPRTRRFYSWCDDCRRVRTHEYYKKNKITLDDRRVHNRRMASDRKDMGLAPRTGGRKPKPKE